ncbi:MAG: M20/M25/M40 family metallo-hydrolase [Thermoleophilia bacterium]|nr:M20/M25/M40 family metallo-hydrolase [Thermoleophilia bacterium]
MSISPTDTTLAAAAALVDADDAVALTCELVRIPSVQGEEGEIARYLQARMERMGFDDVYLQDALPDRPNVVGVVDSGRPGPTLVLTGHIDTKPVCVGWSGDPYSGRLEDGKVHGHAVMDMKAGVATLTEATAALARDRSLWCGKVLLAAVADHMGQQQGAIRFFEEHSADFSILGELTDLEIYLGHRGRLYWDVTAIGRAAHTCHRHLAVNAIAKMVPLVEEVEALRHMPDLPAETVELFGPELYTAVGRIYAGLPPGGPSMIPDECVIRIDSRPQPGVEEEEVRALIEGAIERARARDPEARYELVLADRKRPHLIARDHPLTAALARSIAAITGSEPRYSAGSWLADTASVGQLAPTVIYGPGREPVYMPDEWLDVADIHTAARVYAATAVQLLAPGG